MSRKNIQSGKLIGIGDRIKKIRGSLSQTEFGKILGVEAPAISRYEKGRIPNAEMLNKIAAYGNVTVEWLLHGEAAVVQPQPIYPPIPEIHITQPPALDVEILEEIFREVLIAVEEWLQSRGLILAPVKKADLVITLCRHSRQEGKPVDKDTVGRVFLKIIA